MEFGLYQVALLLTTALLSESDARHLAFRRTPVTRLQQLKDRSRTSRLRQTFRQSMLLTRSLVDPVHALKLPSATKEVIRTLQKLGNFRKTFFVPSKTGHRAQNKNVAKFQKARKIRAASLVKRKDVAREFLRVRRYRRFARQGSKWHKDTITWNIQPGYWSQKLTVSQVNTTLTQAFRTWSEVISTKFRWIPPPLVADIEIKFAKGDHGDSKPFDGPGKMLAHAYYPNYGGDIHFDDDESWSVATAPTGNSKSLLAVTVHEIGHSMGQMHSSVVDSVMSPYYNIQSNNVVLSDDDISGIQTVYDLCEAKVEAIESSMGDGRTYIFGSDVFWRFNDVKSRSDHGYPSKISQTWTNVPKDIDEVFLWGHNWRTYFFKGHQYYKYNDYYDMVENGYPRNISVGWQGVPTDGIDAAFTWSDLKSYFFKGDQVYLFDNVYDQVASGYPQLISQIWPGLPNNLDSAFRWYYDGQTYFFKDEYYWKWDDYNHVAKGPNLIKNHWRNLCHV